MPDTHHVPHHYGPASEDIAMGQAIRERAKVCEPGNCPIEWSRMIDAFECTKCGFFTSDREQALYLSGESA